MRGGKFQQRTVGEEGGSLRNAEMLFQTRPIADIREVEARTRKDIEEKKEELRQLVGASYRDLIESADSILAMRRSCEAVLSNVGSMERRFASLKTSISAARLTPKADLARKHKEALYSVSCRVKYLVDTPEKIWGCLDEHLYLEAAERYVRAREVHQLVTLEQQGKQGNGLQPVHAKAANLSTADMLGHFPLLRHQWPLIDTFKQQISQRSRERLLHQGATVEEYAVALSALAVIDGLNGGDILQVFLQSRRQWIQSLVEGAKAQGQSEDPGLTVSRTFSAVVDVVKGSLCHAGQLFLDTATSAQQQPLFFATLLEAPPESQLFGGLPSPEPEIEAWKRHRENLELQAGAGLPTSQVSEAVRGWLRACAQDLTTEASFLLGSVDHISSLASAESGIRDAIADRSAFAGSLDWLAVAFGKVPESPWEATCELLLREPVELWTTLLEGLFRDRAKAIVQKVFGELNIAEELEAVLSDPIWNQGQSVQRAGASSLSEREDGLVDENQALDAEHLLLNEFRGIGVADSGTMELFHSNSFTGTWGSKARSSMQTSTPLSPSHSADNDDVLRSQTSYRLLSQRLSYQIVTGIRVRVDASLQAALQDVLSFLAAAPDAALAVSRSEDLAPCLQHAAFRAFASLLSSFQKALREFGGTQDAQPTADVNVDKPLLIGRVSAALARHSLWLPVVLGPPEDWSASGLALALGARPPTPGGRGAPGAALLPTNKDSPSQGQGAGMPVVTCDGAALLEAISTRRKQRHSSSAFRRPSGSAGGTKPTPDGQQLRDFGKLKEILRGLRHISVAAHQPWVDQTVSRLCAAFSLSLQKDGSLSTNFPLKGWEETVVKQASMDGKEEVEMKMLLPAMPSAYVLSFLYCSCSSIQSAAAAAGGAGENSSNSLDPAVLQMLAWKLDAGILKAYEALLSATGGGSEHQGTPPDSLPVVSEKGVLQLLFDFRFATDVLAGGQDVEPQSLPELLPEGDPSLLPELLLGSGVPHSPSSGGPVSGGIALLSRYSASAGLGGALGTAVHPSQKSQAKVAARKKRVGAAIETLQWRLDPIDWAAYEPYLWQNEQRFYLRTAVLLGSLVQLHRLHSDVNIRGQPFSRQTDANVLNTAPAVPRFVFLPISAPALPLAVGAHRKRSSGPRDKARTNMASAAAAATAAASSYGGLFNDSSFSSISAAAGSAAALDPLAALSFAADQSGLTSAISEGATPLIQSLMGQVKFGSLLTDGSAQVGRNISSLQDILPSHAAGLFSSLTNSN